jgi:ribosomal protein S18 acetylase RimI-like enzyme
VRAVTFRNAEATDLVALSKLAALTFRDAFAAFNTEEDMRLYCETNFNVAALAGILTDSNKRLVVAEPGTDLVAYAQVHIGETCSSVPAARPVELHRFYIASAWHGTGLAAEFLDDIVRFSRQCDADVLWLGVWENNRRAIRFYEKCGFLTVGAKEFMLGHDRQNDLVMSLDLAVG